MRGCVLCTGAECETAADVALLSMSAGIFKNLLRLAYIIAQGRQGRRRKRGCINLIYNVFRLIIINVIMWRIITTRVWIIITIKVRRMCVTTKNGYMWRIGRY